MSEKNFEVPTIIGEPTEQELQDAVIWENTAHDRAVAEAEQLRQAAYAAEADPLFFKSQRGKATKQEWLDKIAEIEARYPDPEPPKKSKK